MSEYGYGDDRRRRAPRTREPEYVQETTYSHRGNGRPSQELVYRPREDSIEDIPRNFPPPGGEYRRSGQRDYYDPPRRARSAGRRDYYNDNYSDYGPPAGGRSRRDHRRDDASYYSDDYERPRRERRKSRVGEALEDLGLGGVVGAVLGNKSRSRSRDRRRRDRDRRGDYYDRSRSRSRSRHRDTQKKWQQAAKAAALAGAVEAVKSRKTPGPWTGEKGTRIATAALAAAGIDGFIDRDPDEKSKRHIIESAVGGLAANRLANGSAEDDRRDSRGRSRSRSRSVIGRMRSRSRSLFGRRSPSRGREEGGGGAGLKDVAALGGVAAVGKAIYDRVRSKSRRRRSPSSSSTESYEAPQRRQRYRQNRGGPPSDGGYNDDKVARPRGRNEERGNAENDKRDDSSSSVSTTDMERRRKTMRGKELITAGLATVATIHAAHGVYSSMVASEKRHKLVMEGEMSPEEARKRKSKNMLQDVAAVGIAALSVKSAFSEWKEMNEQRHEVHQLEMRRRKRRKAKEAQEREMRLNGGGFGGMNGANPYLIYPVPMPMPPANGGPTAYADGNPYGVVSNLPPPPIGVSQQYQPQQQAANARY